MAKLTTPNLSSLANQTSAINTINTNFDAVDTALENTLSRDGTTPNTMGASLDMNSNRILNLPAPQNDSEPMRFGDITSITGISGTITAPGTSTATGLVKWVGTTASQIASTNVLVASNGNDLTVPGTLTVTGALAATSNIAVNTNKFTVAASSGNTVVAGTLGVTGAGTFTSTLASAGFTCTTLNASGLAALAAAATVGTTLAVTGTSTLTGAVTTGTTLTAGGQFNAVAGTTAIAPIQLTGGSNLTTPVAGAVEFDGVQFYHTIDTSSGRGIVPVQQTFKLTSAGSAISTIANFFGSASNISLVSGAHYIIEVYAWFLNTTAGTVVWTLTNSAAPTSQNIHTEFSPASGLVAPPGTATMLVGDIYNDTTAAKALTATAALTDLVNHRHYIKITLINSTGTSLKIQATKSAGTITPGIGSYWTCRRIPTANVGTFAA